MESKLIVHGAIDFICALYNLEKQVAADGKVNMSDLGFLMGALPGLTNKDAAGIFKNLPKALGSLTQQDVADVLSYAAGKFALKDVRTQKIISESVQLLLNAYRLVEVLGEKKI